MSLFLLHDEAEPGLMIVDQCPQSHLVGMARSLEITSRYRGKPLRAAIRIVNVGYGNGAAARELPQPDPESLHNCFDIRYQVELQPGRSEAMEDWPGLVKRSDPDFNDPRYQRRIMKLWRPIPIVENIHEVILSCGHSPLLLGNNPTPAVGMDVFCGDCRDESKDSRD